MQGWRVVRPGSGVCYDRERMDGALRVFADEGEAIDDR
jgi:hypothetical protein